MTDEDKSLLKDHPAKTASMKKAGPKTTPPTKEELGKMSRTVYRNLMKQLKHTDEHGMPTMSPALVNAVSKFLIESSSVYEEPSDTVELDMLSEKLVSKRQKRGLRISNIEGIATAPDNKGPALGYVDLDGNELTPEKQYEKAEALHVRSIKSGD